MLIAWQVELIDKHKFGKTALDKTSETFVLYVRALKISPKMTIHAFWAGLILQKIIQLAVLQYNKVSTKISPQNKDLADVFSFNLVNKLPKNIGPNKHVITWVNRETAFL